MTIAQAEAVKGQWTDQYVVVQPGIAELRRFEGLTGRVKTVNMSGRALVQFDGPVDIGWYDIDPACLQRVDQPQPKPAAGHGDKGHAKPAATATEPKPPAKGRSPLDQIRRQAAAQPAAAPDAGGKPSPLDLIRKQGAAQSAAVAPAAAPAAPSAAAAPPPAGMSPLDLIRKQGAAKR